ncbi:MAG: SDR family oxidoreductase [Akkermansiaceae bacterium]|nr:SDR family oxidoreductase [Armatimonadota bacterium]
MTTIDLSGKHVLIVGGSRGIGASAARTVAKAGANVSLTYRDNANAAAAVVADIHATGGGALALQADVQDEAVIEAAVASATAAFGPLAGVVISAGIFEHRTIETMTLDFWDRTMATNLTGTMLAVRAVQKGMRESGGGGSIVIYTSTAGQSGGGGGSAAYCVSKAGQIMFMKCMAHELAPHQIRVNCVAPAWTETDMAAASLDRLGREKVARDFPLGRIGQPQDVADATLFLLSDLSAFITGVTLTVDGGIAMRG